MPRNATLDQRLAWHIGHAAACACRPIPDKLADEMKRRGIAVPKSAAATQAASPVHR